MACVSAADEPDSGMVTGMEVEGDLSGMVSGLLPMEATGMDSG